GPRETPLALRSRRSGAPRSRGRRPAAQTRSVSPVHRDDAGAAEADVVLEGDARAFDLSLLGRTVQLPDELGTLRQACRTERVALREKTARGVHHPLAAVGGLVLVDEAAALAGLAELERLVGDELVGAEAVVKLDDVDVLGTEAGLLVDRRG